MSFRQSMDQHSGEIEKLNIRANEEVRRQGYPEFETLLEYFDRAHYILEDWPKEREYAFACSFYVKDWCDNLWSDEQDMYRQLYWEVLKWEAQNRVLDSYMLYLEKNRDYKDRFYEPRRKCFMKCGLVQALQEMLDDKLDILSISMPPGTGKLLADDTPVLTSDGWKNHGDLRVGDLVYGLDGKFKKVQFVFPKDKADCIITFSNGEKIQCHENHEWVVFDRKRNKERTIETKELFCQQIESGIPGKRGHRYHYQLPKKNSFSGEEKVFPVDPYVLGAWLGDGTEVKPCVTICDTDHEILHEIEKHYELGNIHDQKGCKVFTFKGLRKDLNTLKMCHSRKKMGKRIPDVYLSASEQQRLDLLAGIIDTDGCCSKKEKKYHISTINEELKDGIVSLISTFGWRANVSVKKAKTSSSGIAGKHDVYTIGFSPTFKIPCRVLRKQMDDFSEQRKISIVSIERVKPKTGNCIQVEGGIYCVGKTMIPTHNSTVEKFFHSGLCGWFPDEYNLFYSHSGDITRMYYEGMLDILTNSDEYTWREIFPNSSVTATNAKTEQINIDKYKPFKNVQCTSVGAKNAGKVRASKFLLCDDLIGGIEEALNKNTLDKLWNIYAVDARQRKITGCKEIHIATRWSVHDVIGRLQNLYDGGQRCKFIAVPDIDPVSGESNFLFDINGFTVEFFHDQEKVMDEISYRCLYKNEPIEREGLLYTEDSIRRYYNLPSGQPEMIYMQCDHKDTGTDYMIAPVLLKYGDDYYCTDCVCSTDPDYENQYRNLANLIIRNKVQSAQFERNQGGGRVAKEINERVEKAGWICNITDEPTESNKEARIFQCANWIKQHVLFMAKENYSPKSDYGEMMAQLMTYSTQGKNPHDDIPDCFSLFALRITGGNKVAKIEPVFNPFWG